MIFRKPISPSTELPRKTIRFGKLVLAGVMVALLAACGQCRMEGCGGGVDQHLPG